MIKQTKSLDCCIQINSLQYHFNSYLVELVAPKVDLKSVNQGLS